MLNQPPSKVSPSQAEVQVSPSQAEVQVSPSQAEVNEVDDAKAKEEAKRDRCRWRRFLGFRKRSRERAEERRQKKQRLSNPPYKEEDFDDSSPEKNPPRTPNYKETIESLRKENEELKKETEARKRECDLKFQRLQQEIDQRRAGVADEDSMRMIEVQQKRLFQMQKDLDHGQ